MNLPDIKDNLDVSDTNDLSMNYGDVVKTFDLGEKQKESNGILPDLVNQTKKRTPVLNHNKPDNQKMKQQFNKQKY